MSILINDVSPRVHYIATDGQTVFVVPFEWMSDTHLKVYVNEVLCTFDAPPLDGMHYSAIGVGATGGGTINFGPPGRLAGDQVIIFRDMPIARVSDFPTTGVFPVSALNDTFDAMTTMIQQTEVNVQKRTLRMADNDFLHPINSIPYVPERRGRILAFDYNGHPICLDMPDGTTGSDGITDTPPYGGRVWYVDTRNEMKFVNPAAWPVVYLREFGREGMFVWTVDDFAARIAADTQQGIYIGHATIAPSVGAWKRIVQDKRWHFSYFGITTSLSYTLADDRAPQINAMMALANIDMPSTVYCGPGTFVCGSRITTPAFQMIWEGVIGDGQGTLFYKLYTETTPGLGLFSVSTHGVRFKNLLMAAGAGSGGSCISVIPPNGGTTGDTSIENCNLSSGIFVDYTVYIDGSLSVTGGVGVRDMRIVNTTIFGANLVALYVKSVRLLFVDTLNLSSSGGGTGNALTLTGTSVVVSQYVNFGGGSISGAISLDYCDRVLISTPTINGSISNTANVTHTTVKAGSFLAGTMQHNWDNNSCWYDVGKLYMDWVSVHLSGANQSNVTGDGTKQAVLFNTNFGASPLNGWDGTLNYNFTTPDGRFTARRAGIHELDVSVGLIGLLAAHTICDIAIETFTAAGAGVYTRTQRVNPWAAVTTGGRASLQISKKLYMDAGHYATVSLTVTGGTKVVSFEFASAWTHAMFKLV